MEREYKCVTVTGMPKVSYRETLASEYKCVLRSKTRTRGAACAGQSRASPFSGH